MDPDHQSLDPDPELESLDIPKRVEIRLRSRIQGRNRNTSNLGIYGIMDDRREKANITKRKARPRELFFCLFHSSESNETQASADKSSYSVGKRRQMLVIKGITFSLFKKAWPQNTSGLKAQTKMWNIPLKKRVVKSKACFFERVFSWFEGECVATVMFAIGAVEWMSGCLPFFIQTSSTQRLVIGPNSNARKKEEITASSDDPVSLLSVHCMVAPPEYQLRQPNGRRSQLIYETLDTRCQVITNPHLVSFLFDGVLFPHNVTNIDKFHLRKCGFMQPTFHISC